MAPITLDVLADRMVNQHKTVRGDLADIREDVRDIRRDAKETTEIVHKLAVDLSSRVSNLEGRSGIMSGIMSKLSLGLLTKVTLSTGGLGGIVFAAFKWMPQ